MPTIAGASFRAEGFDRIQRMLAHLTGPQLKKAVKVAGRKIGTAIKVRLMRYPGRPSYPLKWASQKQRAWYFAARKADGLPIEYTRMSDPWSGQLKTSWDVVAQGATDTLVGSKAPESIWTQSSEFQTEMHKATGWKTDEQVVRELDSSGVIIKTVVAEVGKLIEGALR
jgi:hypothetical protein